MDGIVDLCELDCAASGGACNVPGCGSSVDSNSNGTPDECDRGACCFVAQGGIQSCGLTTQTNCEDTLMGVFRGIDVQCPAQNVGIITEPGGQVFVHVIGPPVDCLEGGLQPAARPAGCTPPYKDAWESPADGQMCHSFDPGDGGESIPAGFFDTNSDAFAGSICLQGVSLGDPDFPGADTLIERDADPFGCSAGPFPETASPVAIRVVELSLANDAALPVIVSYNGGQNPEQWDVTVGLSDSNTPPDGTLTATRNHCNGGTYVSELNVWPTFTFTRRSDNAMRELTLMNYVTLSQTTPAPWVHDAHPDLGVTADVCSYFRPGVTELEPTTSCDCDGNSMRDACDLAGGAADCNTNQSIDSCDIASGVSQDTNMNGSPDECDFVPALPPRAENGATQLNKGTSTAASCTSDADCRVMPQGANAQIFCIPDDSGGLPGTCYVAKNRYISIAANPANAGKLTARRVSKDENANGMFDAGTDLVLGWVIAPVTSRTATGEPAPQKQSTIDVIAVPPAAYYIDWTVQGAFATNIVHVGDSAICPGRTYLVQEIVLGSDVTSESSYSSATKFPTVAKWGDVLGGAGGLAPQNTTNFGDALGIIQGFSAAQSVSKVWLDLEPASPNFAAVGFPDVLRCTQAIASQPYPFAGCP